MPGRTRTEGGLRSCGLNPGAPTPACETHRGGRKGWRECRQIRAGARTALGLRAGGETPARAWAPHTGLWLRTRALDVPHAVREPRCGCVRREARRAGARRPRCMVRTERRLLANAAAGKGGGASGRPPGSPCHRCGSVGTAVSLSAVRNSMESRKRCKLASSTAHRGAATSRQYP